MPKTLEEALAEPPAVRIRGLLEYIESNTRMIDTVMVNLRECTTLAQQLLAELERDATKASDAQ